MARHILQSGQVPTFYYGQSYLGPLEPVTAALTFAAFGPSVWSLRLAPALYSLVFVYLTARYARQAFGTTAQVATLAYLAVPPLFLLTWSVKARGGYSAMLALGAAILCVTLDLERRPASGRWRWPLLGALGGLLVWTDPLGIVYVIPSAAYLMLTFRRRLVGWPSLIAIASGIVASLPMLAANVASRGETLRELATPNASTSLTPGTLARHLVETARISFPVLIGFYQASSDRSAFLAAIGENLALGHRVGDLALVVALGCVALAAVALRHLIGGRVGPLDLLAGVVVCTLGLFVVSQLESLYATEPRYLLPLYSAVPAVAALVPAGRSSRRRLAASVILAGVLAINVDSVWRFNPELSAPVLNGQVIRSDDPGFTHFLESRGITTLYANYWIGYPVAFQSGERIVTSVIDNRLAIGFNRYIPYAITVDQAASPAVVVVADSPAETRLRARLAQSRATYAVTRWHNLAVFDRISPRFRPGG